MTLNNKIDKLSL